MDKEKLFTALKQFINDTHVANPTLFKHLPLLTEAMEAAGDDSWKQYCSKVDPLHANDYLELTGVDKLRVDGRLLKQYKEEDITEELIRIAMSANRPLTIAMVKSTGKINKKFTNESIITSILYYLKPVLSKLSDTSNPRIQDALTNSKIKYVQHWKVRELLTLWKKKGNTMTQILPELTTSDWLILFPDFSLTDRLFSDIRYKTEEGVGIVVEKEIKQIETYGLPSGYINVLHKLIDFTIRASNESRKYEELVNNRFSSRDTQINHPEYTLIPFSIDTEENDALMGTFLVQGKFYSFKHEKFNLWEPRRLSSLVEEVAELFRANLNKGE